MALQKTVDLPTEYGESVTISDMYIRVSEVKGNKYRMIATVTFHRDSTQPELYRERHDFVPNLDSNFIEQAYLHLKSMYKFSDSIDV